MKRVDEDGTVYETRFAKWTRLKCGVEGWRYHCGCEDDSQTELGSYGYPCKAHDAPPELMKTLERAALLLHPNSKVVYWEVGFASDAISEPAARRYTVFIKLRNDDSHEEMYIEAYGRDGTDAARNLGHKICRLLGKLRDKASKAILEIERPG